MIYYLRPLLFLMQPKLLLILAIVVLLMLLFFVMESGKKHKQIQNPMRRLAFTLRSLAIIVALLLFLIFSVLR